MAESPVRVLPHGVAAYSQTREFDHDSVPAGLLADHTTKAGTWGRLEVLEGALWLAFADGRVRCTPEQPGVIPPQEPHQVELDGPVRFRVVFLRDGPG